MLGGSADGSNPQADANLIDAGPNGQTVANADVLTSPDQFQFPVLDGAGTDALAGVLGGQDGTGPSLVPDAGVPAVDVGTNPIVDVDLAGNADAGHDAKSAAGRPQRATARHRVDVLSASGDRGGASAPPLRVVTSHSPCRDRDANRAGLDGIAILHGAKTGDGR